MLAQETSYRGRSRALELRKREGKGNSTQGQEEGEGKGESELQRGRALMSDSSAAPVVTSSLQSTLTVALRLQFSPRKNIQETAGMLEA